MPFTAEAITLTEDERAELVSRTQSRTLPNGDVFRAKLVLMLADGVPYRTIQEKLDTTAPRIARRGFGLRSNASPVLNWSGTGTGSFCRRRRPVRSSFGDRQEKFRRPWEEDILLVRNARLGISEYAPGAQVVAAGRVTVWERSRHAWTAV